MNIIVVTYSGAIVVRPDTTWERDNEDLYLPDFIDRISSCSVACARVCKPGRSVNAKFANRYIDKFGFGILLYPEELMDGSSEGFAQACCLDHTSLVPMPDTPAEEYFDIKGRLSIGEKIVDTISFQQFQKTVELITKRIYIRTGDIIAVELEPASRIFDRKNGNKRVSAAVSDSPVIDFNIIVE